MLLQLLIPLVTWSVVTATADVNDFRLTYLDTSGSLLLLFAIIRSVVKSVMGPFVEVAELSNRSHRIRHRSSGDKSVVCVSRIVVKLHSQYRCRLVRRTPYASCPAIDDSVLIVAVRECIVASGSVSAPRPR